MTSMVWDNNERRNGVMISMTLMNAVQTWIVLNMNVFLLFFKYDKWNHTLVLTSNWVMSYNNICIAMYQKSRLRGATFKSAAPLNQATMTRPNARNFEINDYTLADMRSPLLQSVSKRERLSIHHVNHLNDNTLFTGMTTVKKLNMSSFNINCIIIFEVESDIWRIAHRILYSTSHTNISRNTTSKNAATTINAH